MNFSPLTEPQMARARLGSICHSCVKLVMPARSSRRDTPPPTPGMARSGNCASASGKVCVSMTVSPSGLCRSLASLASSPLGAMPIEHFSASPTFS